MDGHPPMSDDITDRIADVHRQHVYEFGFATNCSCGEPGIWFWDDYVPHIAAAVADLLIDLAGTGQLLAGIDRIAREPGEC
jgi:hypothetical protein